MMRSLFSGVTGLKTHQTKMDVIGNNIANVNTVGFKSSNVTFSELMYQTTQNASGANAATGRAGINAKQIGLGVTNGAINTNITTSGASQTTGNPFDIQITGDSFFIVSDGSNNYFTRAGAFYVDGVGNLAMTSNGFTVMGWKEDPLAPGFIKKDTVQALQITSPENMQSDPEATTAAYMTGIIDKNTKSLTTSGQVINLSFYDNLGYSYVAKYNVTTSDASKGIYKMTLSDIVYEDGAGTTQHLPAAQLPNINGSGGKDIYIVYDVATGRYKGWDASSTDTPANGPDVAFTMDFNQTDTPAFKDIGVNMKNTTMFDNNGTSTVAAKAGNTDGQYAGRKVGTMSGVSVQTDGKIYAAYDNGTSKLLGQIAVASFPNPSGLEKVGENLYQTTQNSGLFDGIGIDVTSDGIGKMQTGVLEMSNVDLSAEFTEMITTQRGFQANSRIITVSDSLLEELTNLKR
ncbi:MAG: flagellar hook-basal body complex protein [Lachnospiraceae bacterium]|nr:flagellar hook-basal body complex protein [Lachnospiraceae bacterium]